MVAQDARHADDYGDYENYETENNNHGPPT
jgi:hypothetical protein